MSVPESVQEPRRRLRWLLVVVGLCLLLPLDAAEPPKGEMSAAERQAKRKEADRLNGQILALYRKGGIREAIPLAERALALRKQVLGTKHPDYGQSLNNLAELYRAIGDYAKAEPLHRQARAIRKQALGDKHPDYAQSLNNLALLYYAMGDHAKAVPLLREALAIRKQALGDKHPDYATGLNNLAGLYYSMGDYAKAEPLYRQTLAIQKQALGDKHPDYALSLNNLAELYRAMGDYAKAEPLHRQARAIRKQALGDKHPDYAQSLNNLAELYDSMGDYAKAEPLYRQASEIYKQALGNKHPDYANSLNNLAGLYRAMGDYAKAEPLVRQALAIDKEALGDKHPGYAADLDNLAGLYRAMGDYAKAEPLHKQALDIRKQSLGDKHPDYANSLNNLAYLYDSMDDYAKAEPLYRQALDITRQSLLLTATVQSERQQLAMGESLRFLLDNYLSAVLQAQAKAKLSGDTTLPYLYEHVLAWKGAVFMQQRRQRLARSHPELTPLFDKLQEVSRRLATRALAVPAREQRAAWRKDIAELTEQKEHLESELASRCAAFDSDRQLSRLTAKDLQAVLPADAVLLDFLEYWQSPPDTKKTWNWLGEWHVAAFVVRRGRPLVLKDLGAAKDIAEAIQSWRRAVAAKGDGHGGGDPAGRLRRLLWQPLAEAVGDAAVVLVSPDGVLGTFPFAALPGDKDDHYLIEERGVAVVAVPQLLPDLLRDDAKDRKDNSSSLLLVGDVDFDAGGGKPVLADAGRSAARGLRQGAVGQFRPLAATRGEILAVRDSFEQRHPDAKVKPLRAAAATEAAFRRQAPSYRYLHLATHGFFAPAELKSALAPSDPKKMALMKSADGDPFGRLGVSGYHPGLLSGLALAGANNEAKPGEDDGILTALEVASLDLSSVEVAVLSACETGLGQTAGGEGLLGLQRAFQVSGAHTVVASLWTVDDEWTRKLMERYYENLWQKKMPKLKALREAQRWVMREAPKRGGLERPDPAPPRRVAPPFYWAAFVLSGDWR